MSELEAAIRGLAAVVRDPDALARLEADPEGFLAEAGVPETDRAAMLKIGVDRLRAYRALVQNRFANVVGRYLPRTEHFVGASELRAEVEAFIGERASHSPYLRSIPGEFVDWVASRWREHPARPQWLESLARYELLSETVPNSPTPAFTKSDAPVALDRPILSNPSAKLVRFAWAVDRVSEDAPSEPEAEDITLVVCRDLEHRYRERRVDPLEASLFEALVEGKNLQEAIFTAAKAIGEDVADPLLARATRALATLGDMNALLGPPT
jgi:hypothetical protein